MCFLIRVSAFGNENCFRTQSFKTWSRKPTFPCTEKLILIDFHLSHFCERYKDLARKTQQSTLCSIYSFVRTLWLPFKSCSSMVELSITEILACTIHSLTVARQVKQNFPLTLQLPEMQFLLWTFRDCMRHIIKVCSGRGKLAEIPSYGNIYVICLSGGGVRNQTTD